ncbi:MAG: TPM domain-containing protein [Thermoanaerobaculia bacterium]
MRLESILSKDEIVRVEAKIGAAESLTTAQIRVALTGSSWMGIRNKARKVFRKHRLDRSRDRNTVLLLVDVRNRELLIYGDRAIDEKVEAGFWNDVRDAMLDELREKRIAEALTTGIHQIGTALQDLFPPSGENDDEISNALIFEP